MLKRGSPTWIRTTILGAKGRCPTVRRSGNRDVQKTSNFSVAKRLRGDLPVGVGGSVEGGFVGAAMDIEDAGRAVGAADGGIFHGDFPGLVGVGDGVLGNLAEVAIRDKVVEGFGGVLLIDGVFVDHVAERKEIVAQYAFLGADDRFLIDRNGYGEEDRDDRHHDHQLDQGEAAQQRVGVPGPTLQRSQARRQITC